jgi:hypothetical protein
MKTKKVTVEIPENMELVKKGDTVYFVEPIKEKTAEEKLEDCMNKIKEWNKGEKNNFHLNSFGGLDNTTSIDYNHATENRIKAEQILMVMRRMAWKYNEVFDDGQYVFCLGNDVIEIHKFSGQYLYGDPSFSSREIAEKVIEKLGEENIKFMLNNLK